MDGISFLRQDAVTLALLFVIADQAANRCQGIVLKEDPSRLVKLVFFQELYYLGDRCFYRATLQALRIFALQAAVDLIHNV